MSLPSTATGPDDDGGHVPDRGVGPAPGRGRARLLPQLWNVLKGDMSLVGPGPALPAEADLYGSYVRRRLVVKPGITGLGR